MTTNKQTPYQVVDLSARILSRKHKKVKTGLRVESRICQRIKTKGLV
jgi:hypothetical protein